MLRVALCHSDATVPRRHTTGSVGYDLTSVEEVVIPAGGRRLVSTGLKITVPPGTYGRIAPRSGLSCKGINVGAGVCDPDYTGIYKVLLFNHSAEEFQVRVGDRIAQLVVEVCATPDVLIVDALEKASERGEAGFGSTGGHAS